MKKLKWRSIFWEDASGNQVTQSYQIISNAKLNLE